VAEFIFDFLAAVFTIFLIGLIGGTTFFFLSPLAASSLGADIGPTFTGSFSLFTLVGMTAYCVKVGTNCAGGR
jgi:hypothetical protein